MRYSRIGAYIDRWVKNPGPRKYDAVEEQLGKDNLEEAIRIGCFARRDNECVLRRREMIHPQLGKDDRRRRMYLHDLTSTLEDNAEGANKFERRTYVAGLSVEDALAFRAFCHDRLSEVLIELDDWLVARDGNGTHRVGLAIFNFDDVPIKE